MMPYDEEFVELDLLCATLQRDNLELKKRNEELHHRISELYSRIRELEAQVYGGSVK
jgi:prefoldin subunit 5